MDYEKKYKEALEWAGKVIYGKVGFVLDEVLEVFPELKESNDEKIRKALIFHYQGDGCIRTNSYRIDFKDIRTWLEELGKQKSIWSGEDEKMYVNIRTALLNANKDYSKEIGWFYLLRLQKQWMPSEKQIDALSDALFSNDIKCDVLSELLTCLKKLRGGIKGGIKS